MQLYTEPWTIVFIDGRVAEATPLFSEEIPEGPHNLRMVNEEFGIDQIEKITVRTGERKKLFKRFFGTLEIELPAGADTYLNGEHIQSDTPSVSRKLSCGYFQVKRVCCERGTETRMTVLLRDGERKAIA